MNTDIKTRGYPLIQQGDSQWYDALLLAHPVFGSHLRPCCYIVVTYCYIVKANRYLLVFESMHEFLSNRTDKKFLFFLIIKNRSPWANKSALTSNGTWKNWQTEHLLSPDIMNVMQSYFFFPLSFQELTEICNAFVTSFVKWIQLIRHLFYFKQIWKCNFWTLISFVSCMFYNQLQPMSLLDISVVKFLFKILKMCLLISKLSAFQYHCVGLLIKDTINWVLIATTSTNLANIPFLCPPPQKKRRRKKPNYHMIWLLFDMFC